MIDVNEICIGDTVMFYPKSDFIDYSMHRQPLTVIDINYVSDYAFIHTINCRREIDGVIFKDCALWMLDYCDNPQNQIDK